MKHQANITDIAKKSGFSITTVSRVLNGIADKYRISKSTQEKIKSIAEECNYVPNEFARSLRMGKSKTIALIIPSLRNPFFAEIASLINREVKKYDYITIIGDSDDDIKVEKREVSHFSTKNIDGLIIVPCGKDWEHLDEINKKGVPLVCVDRYFENQTLPFVSSDNYEGAYAAAMYLIKKGHKKISCIQGVNYSAPNKQRVLGFKQAMADSGIKTYEITGNAFTEQNGYFETKLLLQQKNRPTAIFAFNNTIALGCLKAFKEENIKIPKDISLITFDDSPYLNYIEPPITCIAQPIDKICKIAVKILFSNILDNDSSTKQVLLKTNLEIKKSVQNLLN